MSGALLAIDLGTSALKALLVDRSGTVVGRQRIAYETRRTPDGGAEQTPADWWAALGDAVRQLTNDAPGIAAIGITGQMHGLVVHDARDHVMRPAIIWQDRRSETSLPELLHDLPGHHRARRDGSIASGYQAASWRWLAESSPGIAARAAHILLPKDELIYRLTGHHLTDPSDAVSTGWYDAASGRWDLAVVDAAHAHPVLLPRIVPAGSVAGEVDATVARDLGVSPGIPVVIAGGDAAVAAFGAGATDPDVPLLMLSTGCQLLQSVRDPMDNAPVWPSAAPAGLPRWLKIAATLNGGNTVRWARSMFGEPDIATNSGDTLFFLPYLAGERSGDLRDNASGAFVGLRAHHTRRDMASAAIAGVALAAADAFSGIGGTIGTDQPMLVGGGGVRDDAWLAAIARTFARPVHAITEPDLSAWGAGRSAATALGWIDPERDPAAWSPGVRRLDPDPAAVETARNRLSCFRAWSRRMFGVE